MINQISDQLDANIIGKLTYLPRCVGMKVSSTKEAILVNTEIPCDMFNVACLINNNADLESIANSFHNLPFAFWVATKMIRHMLLYAHDEHNYKMGVLTATKSGEKVYKKIGFQKIKEFFIFNL